MILSYIPPRTLYRGLEPGNGTTPIVRSRLDEKSLPADSRWLVVENMTISNLALLSAPKRARVRPRLRPEVATSLEHSLDEHADVWAELAKH